MVQTLVDHGHNYLEVVNEYTQEELGLLYRACLRLDLERDEEAGWTARIASQGDAKSFKKWAKQKKDAIEKVRRPFDPTGKPVKPVVRKDDKAYRSFFDQIAKLPDKRKAQRAADKAAREGRTEDQITADDFDNRRTVPVVRRKKPLLGD
jgi:hypothetical protein